MCPGYTQTGPIPYPREWTVPMWNVDNSGWFLKPNSKCWKLAFRAFPFMGMFDWGGGLIPAAQWIGSYTPVCLFLFINLYDHNYQSRNSINTNLIFSSLTAAILLQNAVTHLLQSRNRNIIVKMLWAVRGFWGFLGMLDSNFEWAAKGVLGIE